MDEYDDFEDDVDFDCDEDYENEYLAFNDPGGQSALRAETPSNPRIHPCPNCERPNMLTPKDVELGYQCDLCADADESGQ